MGVGWGMGEREGRSREGGKWEVGVGWWEEEREGRSREGGRWE